MNVHTLSRLESKAKDSDKMSSFHYDGARNVLCTPASMSRDVRIQPTPQPTPWSLCARGLARNRMIENGPHLARELRWREWLLQERRSAVQYAAAHYLVVGIARHEEHLYVASRFGELFDEWPSTLQGHYYV